MNNCQHDPTSRISEVWATQEIIDDLYNEYATIVNSEIEKFFKPLQNCPKSDKQFYHSRKAWWDEEALLCSIHVLHRMLFIMYGEMA